MRVREIMQPLTTNYLKPEQTLLDATCIMRDESYRDSAVNGMLVLEDDRKLVGVVSIKDVIRAVVPTYLVENLSEFSWEGLLEERAAKVRTLLVREIMATDIVTVDPDDLAISCADLMIVKQFQRMPVVAAGGRVVGMVHIRDIYRTIADYICGQEA